MDPSTSVVAVTGPCHTFISYSQRAIPFEIRRVRLTLVRETKALPNTYFYEKIGCNGFDVFEHAIGDSQNQNIYCFYTQSGTTQGKCISGTLKMVCPNDFNEIKSYFCTYNWQVKQQSDAQV